FIKGLVDEDFNVSQDDGVGVVSGVSILSANSYEGLNERRVANNDMLLLEGGDGFFDSDGGATNPESNKDKQPTLADFLMKFVLLERKLLCTNVAGALIGIHKADGNNDSPNVNHNAVNKGLSCPANDPMSTCSSHDMDDGEVSVAGMGIHKADGQNDVPNANDNAVNQVIIGSANDPMLDVLIQVVCDCMGIDKVDGNNDYTYSQREPSTLDVLVQGFDSQKNHPGIDVIQHDTHVDCSVAKLNYHPTSDIRVKVVPVDEFVDDFIDVDELIDVHEDKTTVLQENVKDLSNKSQYVNVVKEDYKPCLGMVFANVKAKRKKCGIERTIEPDADWAMVSPHFLTCTLGGSMIDYYSNGVRYPVAWRDVEKYVAELHISTGVVTFYDSLGWVCGNRRPWWRMMKRTLPQQLTLYLNEHGVLHSKGIAVETYEIEYMFLKVVRSRRLWGLWCMGKITVVILVRDRCPRGKGKVDIANDSKQPSSTQPDVNMLILGRLYD
ncbi:hypothetical protein Tco_0975124, partial [Tanacetum coccineum]